MRIYLHIGLPACGAERLQELLDSKRDQLLDKGVLFPRGLGGKNHTRLYMATTDPERVDILRFHRGFADPEKQATLLRQVEETLESEINKRQPDVLFLSASQLGTLTNEAEVARVHALLRPLSDDIRIIAHVDEQARVLVRHYAHTVLSGRTAPLSREIALAEKAKNGWADAALAQWGKSQPAHHQFSDLQAPPHWLDYTALVARWDGVFGKGATELRPYDPELFASEKLTDELREILGIEKSIGKASPQELKPSPSAAWLTRARQMNEVLVALLSKGRVIPPPLWRRLMESVHVPGDPIAPGQLVAFSKIFEKSNKSLLKSQQSLTPASLKRDRAISKGWQEADPTKGYRATQYVASALPRINQVTRAALREQQKAETAAPAQKAMDTSGHEPIQVNKNGLTPVAEKLMSQRAKENFEHLRGGRFEPHNNIGRVDETQLGADYSEIERRDLPKALKANGNSGNVIVGCMKNEAPYILEWVAYHRAMGIDNFLIYTNDCSDGTSEILDHLQEMGVLQHRNNDKWKGNSPQQYALNQSLKEHVIKNAEWVIHIDVDEFINVRCGNGTLQDFLDRVPDATNVAMTWRLFGHNGVTEFADDLVIDQFDTAAPKYAPKPHTVWGFKTMTKNVGAYEKLSCHRPNKLRESHRDQVNWVNGSGLPMSENYKDKGWRSDLKTIGYDLLQLNHYALRSAESYLIKRQRGRALHVDRSIGINYWVRMDWSANKDVTIKCNIPRTVAELGWLMQDKKLADLHQSGVDWHRAKAVELRQNPEFSDLYDQALETKLTEMERVAYALALDMES
ncbi:glycosyltransferase family 2 protein [Aliiroseovarius sp. KMU-50]|uniref:Glycosyltransferase family 2 protein n=1 Tax=Aliiroseovarius salicola TaxID=3009082 RepID=A0ABT4W057_9RHOB|nr:glycosyltransferase family 2 protein [Aliiroseovarius sp. KMU-50]MDA5093898.1 glycosyltransferase family 2 protein [Aliiroseovarius sp. KMU-50]